MPKYYMNSNAQSNGDHEVHKEGCVWLTKTKNPVYIGLHGTCHSAMLSAKKLFKQCNGCATCSKDCHTQ